MLLISTRSIHSLKKIKCHNVGEFTKNGEEMRRTVDKECEDFEGCIAFKGSYVVDGDTYIVSKFRGCTSRDDCQNVENGESFYKDLQYRIEEMSAIPDAESEGNVPTEFKCCYSPLCNDDDFLPGIPVAETSSSGGAVKNYSHFLVCLGFLYSFFI